MNFQFLKKIKINTFLSNKSSNTVSKTSNKSLKSYLSCIPLFLISTSALAVDITLDNTITEISGDLDPSTCLVGDTYRLGTTNTYNGQPLDLLIEITDEDNEYDTLNPNAGPCISVVSGILETRLRKTDPAVGDDQAFMDLKVSVVATGTSTPVEVDRIVFSAFDLDTNAGTGSFSTGTDDVYMIDPSRGYIEAGGNSNVSYNEGSYGSGYDVALTGQTTGDCQDSATNPDPSCRGGGIALFNAAGEPNKVTSLNIRVSNDNAYGQYTGTGIAYRLIQLSFKEADFNAILGSNTDHGDMPAAYLDASHNVSVFTILGFGFPADDDNAQFSTTADLDDADPSTQNFDDEDGVRANGQPTVGSSLGLVVGRTNTIEVTTIGTGFLSAWLDINGNNSFDAGEKILNDFSLSSVTAQNTTISVPIPSGNYTGISYARFRFSQNSGVGSSGAGGFGEVEDYRVDIQPGGDIVGHLYEDLNGNGTQDSGEPNLANVDVIITNSVGAQTTVTTNANGDYRAVDIRPGTATVDIDETDPDYPTGAIQIEGTDPTNVTVLADTDNVEENNGFFLPGTVSGSVLDDTATALTGVTVEIQDASGNVINDTNGNPLTTTTDGTGAYTFTNVPTGDYFIVETDPANYSSVSDEDTSPDGDSTANTDTNDNSIPVTITSGKNDVNNNFVDTALVISIGDVSIVEGNAGTTNLDFPVTLTAPVSTDTTVTFTVADGTGTLGDADYVAPTTTTVVIPAGDTSATISVPVNGDTTVEPDETITVTLDNTDNGTIDAAANVGTGTIQNDDDTVVSIGDVSVVEGNTGTTNLDFPVTLTAPVSTDTTVTFTVADGTGTLGDADYVAPTTTTVVIPAGDTTATISVPVNGDTTVEPDETITVTLDNTDNGTIDAAANVGTGTIQNDDDTVVSIGDVSVVEGNTGTTNLDFPVTLTAPVSTDTTVTFTVADGTGTLGDADYVAPTTTTVVIPAGDTTATISVPVNGDTTVEPDETVTVTLTATDNGTLGTDTGTGTIQNDDGTVVSIGDVSIVEGNAGTTNLDFPVTLTAPVSTDTTVTFTVADGTGTLGDADYVAPTTTTVVIPAGDTSATISVPVNGDTTVEPDETITVTLDNTDNGTIDAAANVGTGTIQNDDDTVVSIGDVSVVEGNASTTNLDFPVTLTAPVSTDTTVTFTVADGTGTLGDADYVAPTTTTVVIPAGDTTATISVPVNGDTTVEPDETVTVTLTATDNGTLGTDTGTGTIQNDDGTVVSIGDVSIVEGNTGTTNLDFPVTLTAPVSTDTTVTFTVADGTGTLGDADYVAPTTTTVVIPAGDTSATISVPVNGDTTVEPDETITVTLDNTDNGTIDAAANVGTGTIQNDDDTVVSIGDVSVVEGNASTTNLDFPVTLTAPVSTDTTVTFTVADGTGTLGDADYVAPTTTTVVIPAGDTTATISVPVNGDTTVEPDETVTVTLTTTDNGTIGTDTGTGTIQNDDGTVVSIGDVSVVEGNAGTTNLDFPVTLTAPVSTDTTVTFTVADGTGTLGDADYVAPTTTTVVIPAGDTSATISVPVNGDTTVEPDETVTVTLTATDNGTLGTDTGTGTIQNDDGTVVSIGDVSIVEGNAGTTNLDFPVTLTAPVSTDTTVTFTVADGTGTLGDADYVAPTTTTVVIPAGDTSATISVPVNGDTTVEPDETVTVTLTATDNGTLGTDTGTGTIQNDDGTVVSIGDVSIVEGNAGTTNLDFPVTLTAPVSTDTTVTFTVADGTGTLGDADYVAPTTTTVVIPAGDTSATISVPVNGDTTVEPDETVTVTLTATDNGTLGTDTGTGTIQNDDGTVVSIGDVSVVEGNAGTTNLDFPVTLTAPVSTDTTVTFTVADGTGTLGDADYVAPTTTTVVIPAGDTSATISVPVNGDTTVEPDETVTVTLTATDNGTLGTDTGTGIIQNDDGTVVSIGDVSVVEGNAGTTNLDFPVTLTAPVSTDTTVTFTVADGTGTLGDADYVAPTTTTVVIPAGDTTATISVPVNGDTTVEPDETITVTLDNTDNGTIDAAANVGTGTIQNDDDTVVSIGDVSIVEGNAGTTNLDFPVTLTAPVSTDTTVTFTVADGTGTLGDADYVAPTTTTVVIPAGDTTATISVPVNGDTTVEPDETVTVTLTATDNGTLGTDTGTGTIQNDDGTVVSIGDVSIVEGNAGTTNLDFPVTLTAPVSTDTTVTFTVADGTGTLGDADYVAPTTTTVVIPAGDTSATISVPVNGDTTVEPDETITVTLDNTDNGTIDAAANVGTGTIQNDDDTVVSIGDVSVVEGNASTTNLDFPVTLTAPVSTDTTVTFTVADGTGTLGDADYVAPTTTTVVIPAGDTTATISVPVNGDTTVEPDETVTVTLTTTDNGTIGTDTGTGTIQNDDGTVVSIGDVSVVEGNAGTTNLDFPVTLTAPVSTDTTVTFTVADGTGTLGDADYVAPTTTTVVIPAGDTSATISVPVNGDTTVEPDETVTVTLTATDNGTLGTDTGTGIIQNDDGTVVSIGDVSVVEGNAGTTNLDFPVTLTAPVSTDTTVTFTVADGTGTLGDADYVAPTTTTVVIPAGDTSATISVPVNGDTTVEPDETVTVTLTATDNGTLGTDTGTGIIQNDDGTVVSIGDVSIVEGNAGTTNLDFPVTLTAPVSTDTTVTFTVADGTGTLGDADYVAPTTTTVVIPAGDTTATISVPVNGDTTVEPDETITVTLDNTDNGTIDAAANVGTGTIQNDDDTVVSIGDVSIVEGNAGTTNLDFPVTLTAPVSTDTTVTFTVADGTGTLGDADYVAPTTTTVVIPAGDTTATISVPVNGDTTVEPDETVTVTLTATDNGTLGTDTGTGTIQNDDGTVVSIGDVSIVEGNAGTTNLDFPVTLTAPVSTDTTVTFTVADGTGTLGDADYVAPTTTTVVIPAGDTSATISVPVNGDTTVEPDETVTVTLTATDNGTLGTDTGTGTIQNDDGTVVSIGDVSVVEGNAGTTNLDFPVTLTAPVSTDTTVTFTVADGTGTLGDADYVAPTTTTVVIPAGDTTATISVPVNGDTTVEPDETVTVTLTATDNGTLGTDTGTGIIQNDDGTVVSIGDVSIVEGNAGTTNLDFPVTLTAPVSTDTTVTFTVADGTGTLGDADYVAPTTTTVVIPAGDTTATISVPVNGDTTVEPDETVTVTLTATDNGTLGTDTGTGTIQNDDGTVVSIGDVSIVEGNAGTTNLDFPVTLTAPVSTDTTVTFTVADGTGTLGDADYVAPTTTTVVIPAGDTSATISVPVNGDTTVEPDETITVTLDNTDNGTIDAAANVGTGTIQNDDDTVVSIGDVSVVEGNASTTNLDFPVTLTAPVSTDTTVTFTVADGTGTLGDADYVAPTTTTVVIPAGDTTATISVPVNGDTTVEPDETVTVTLTTTDNGTIGTDTGTGTIQNDDGTVVSIGDVSVVEGNAGTTNLDFPVTLTAPVSTDTTVTFTVADGTGTLGDADYVAPTTTTVVIPAGDTSATISVPVNGDTTVEPDETVTVTLTATDNGTLGTDTGTGIIQNDDGTVVSIGDVSVVEGNAGTTNLDFPVTLTAPVSTDTTVTFTVADGTGTLGDADYVAPTTTTVVIPAGDTSATISVPVNGDTTVEPDETITVTLDNTDNGTIDAAANVGTGTIQNDDDTVVSIGDVSVVEGNASTTNLDFPVTLTAPVSTDTTVTFTVADGTGTLGDADYVAPTTTTVVIPAGDTSATISVPVNGDTTVEPDETVTVILTATDNGTLGTDTGTGTIQNDDGTVVSIGDVSIVEGNAGTTNLDFPVTLTAPVSTDTTVTFTVADGTGTIGDADYVAPTTTTVVIPAGDTSATISVPVNGDTTSEPNETIAITIDSADIATIDPSANTGTGTILNDDIAPTVTIGDVTVDESAGTATVPVSINLPSSEDTVIEIITTDGTADSSDYTTTTTTVTIPAGELTSSVTVPVSEDSTNESNETVNVNGTVTSNNTSNTDPTGTVTIIDNDGAPTVSIGDVTVDESAGTATVPVSINTPSSEDTIIEIVTTDGTADSSDYTATSTTVTIPAGLLTVDVSIPVSEDTINEPNETINVNGIVTSTNTTNDDPVGIVTIIDNDGAPTVYIGDVTVDESAGTATVPVSINTPSSEDTIIEIVTTDGTAGSSDYTATSTIVTIPAGSLTVDVSIPVLEDTINEPNETINVNGIVTSTNTLNDDPTGTVTILDNDGSPTVSIGNVTVDESAGTATVPVSINSPSSEDTVIEITTIDGTADNSDYTTTTTTVTIPAGQLNTTIIVPILEDTINEPSETVNVNGNVTSGNTTNTDPSGIVTILDNDGAPTVTIGDITVNESAGIATVPVSINTPSSVDTVIEIVTTDGTATSTDYTTTTTIVTIPAGQLTTTVIVPILEDTTSEPNEIVNVNGTVTSGNTSNTDPTGSVTILDNDGISPPNFGEVIGVIYTDTNSNGVQDASEVGIPGVQVLITDSQGNTQTLVTDSDGTYGATVPAGSTTVDIINSTLPVGSTQTGGTDVTVVNVPPNGTAIDRDGYNTPIVSPLLGTVQGVVYLDTNNNGQQDPGETGIPNVRVTITDSANTVSTVTTNNNGQYSQTVFPGSTTIDIVDSDINSTLVRTQGNDPTVLTVLSGTVATDIDGFAPPVIVPVIPQPPVAVDDSKLNQPLGQPVTISTVSNDSDPDNNLDPTTVKLLNPSGNPVTTLTVPGEGTWTVNPTNGDITFTPEVGFLADPTPINYMVKDTTGLDSNIATVTVDYEDPAALTGTVWLDSDKDNQIDSNEDRKAGWTLVIKDSSGKVIATTVTDSQGNYSVTGLVPDEYTVDFFNPNGTLIATQTTGGPLTSGQTVDLPLPIDPSGVVYDSTTREPIPGVLLQLVNSQGTPVDTACLGEGQQNQITDEDGLYAFDVYPDAHSSCTNGEVYTIKVVSAPAGYFTNSTIIPPQTGVFDSDSNESNCTRDAIDNSGSCEVQAQPNAPQGNQNTNYYLDFVLNSGDSNVIFNHIPLDPEFSRQTDIDDNAILVSKSANKKQISIGDQLYYTVQAENTQDNEIDVDVRDDLPRGFKFISKTAKLIRAGVDNTFGTADDITSTIQTRGNDPVNFGPLTLQANEKVRIGYILKAGTAVTQGDAINTVQVFGAGTDNDIASNVATASVQVIADSVLNQSTLIGKVFHDRDGDGYQDPANVTGLTVKSDYFGWNSLHLGGLNGRVSVLDDPNKYRKVIRMPYSSKNDFKVTTQQGTVITVDNQGRIKSEHIGQKKKGLTAQDIRVTTRKIRGIPTQTPVKAMRVPSKQVDVLEITITNYGIHEEGIPGVRIATVKGLLIETDGYGRYHLPDVDGGRIGWGKNIILKVDPVTLPEGASFTTENPRVLRITNTALNKINFGIKLPVQDAPRKFAKPQTQASGKSGKKVGGVSQVVKVELGASFFENGSHVIKQSQMNNMQLLTTKIKQYGKAEITISSQGVAKQVVYKRAQSVRQALYQRLGSQIMRSVKIKIN